MSHVHLVPKLDAYLICVFKATVEDWDKMFAVNARGVFLCYKYAGEQMIKQGRGGRIIGACSSSGKRGAYFNILHAL